MTDLYKQLGIDYNTAVQRFAGDEGLYKKYLQAFFLDANFQELLVLLRSGKDLKEAEKSLYTLKGTAANLGMDCLAVSSERILEDIHAKKSGQEMAQHIMDMQGIYERLSEAVHAGSISHYIREQGADHEEE